MLENNDRWQAKWVSRTCLAHAHAHTQTRTRLRCVYAYECTYTPSTDINSHTWNGFYLGVPLPYIIPEYSTGWLDWDSRQVGRTTPRHMELTSFYAIAAELQDSDISHIHTHTHARACARAKNEENETKTMRSMSITYSACLMNAWEPIKYSRSSSSKHELHWLCVICLRQIAFIDEIERNRTK